MKYLVVLLPLIAISKAQRPTYAGTSPKGYPELASRFRDPDEQEMPVAAVGNRLGDADEAQSIPTDARGDIALVNRLNQWPRENRPFWLINAQHIERHRHPDENAQNAQGFKQDQVVFSQNRQEINAEQTGQIQSRFGGVASETRTVKPLSQRGSFAGVRTQI